ncbi:MAG: site-specific integrase [Acidobacteria bacterium]|nr:site-specific integrase [Acidobacteriota bacterium]
MSEEKPTKKKKSRNVGQCVERGQNKFLLRIFQGRDSAGKRHYHDETFHGGKRQAQDRLRTLLTKHKAGESLKINKDTLNVFLEEWLDSNLDLKDSTVVHYRTIINLYIRPELGNKMLAKIEAGDIQTLYKNLKASGLSRGTISYVHTLIKKVFKLAIRRRRIPFNPMDGVDSPGGKRLKEEMSEKRASRVMTPDQVAAFFAAANETRFGLLFTLAFHTGCRPGELLGLRWSNLDVEAMSLRIQKAIKWQKGKKEGEPEWYLDTPKTEHGRRTLPLTERLVWLFNKHRKRQLEERMRAGRAWKDHDFIFANEIGEPYSQVRLWYICKKILKAAGLPDHFFPYSARHTSATLLMANGVNPKTVSARLGHSDVNVTLQTYTHPTDEMQAHASQEIERVLMGKKR